MQDHSSQIKALLIAALVVFAVYRRLRRTFGRQPLRPIRMQIRMAILSLVGVVFLVTVVRDIYFVAGVLLGLAAGGALAVWGASQTRFEREGSTLIYVPHTYTGILVSLLFLGRFAYRLVQGYTLTRGAAPAAGGTGLSATLYSPLTVGLFFVLVGYYVCYYSLVLRNSRAARAELAGLAGSGSPATGEPSKPA